MIIMRLVVLVPLITCVHSVEVLWLARPVLIVPPIDLHQPFQMLRSLFGGVSASPALKLTSMRSKPTV